MSLAQRISDYESQKIKINAQNIGELREDFKHLLKTASQSEMIAIHSLRSFQELSSPTVRKLSMPLGDLKAFEEDRLGFLKGPRIVSEVEFIRQLSILMLSFHPFELGEIVDEIYFSYAHIEFVFRYLFKFPSYFSEKGEAKQFFLLQRRLLRLLVAELSGSKNNPTREDALRTFSVQYIEESCFFGHDENLKETIVLLRRLVHLLVDRDGVTDFTSRSPANENGRTKIGILRNPASGDWKIVVRSFFALDPNEFEVILYDTTDGETERTAFSPESVPFASKKIPMESIVGAIQFLRNENLDIIFNGSYIGSPILGVNSLILQMRVAPVQATIHSEIYTTGMDTMDYFFIGSRYCNSNLENELVEKPLPMNGIGIQFPLPFRGRITQEERQNIRERWGLPLKACLLVSNAHHYKLSVEALETWVDILSQNPEAQLVLMPRVFGGTELVELMMFQNLERALRSKNIDRSRVHIRSAREQEMREIVSAGDIYLDCFPYSGFFSTCEALVYAIPPVTKRSTQLRGSLVSALLDEINLKDFITLSTDEYIHLASKLIRDLNFRRSVSNRISETLPKHPLLSGHYFAEQMNHTLRALLQKSRSAV